MEGTHQPYRAQENLLPINCHTEEIQLPVCHRQIKTKIKGELTQKLKDKKHSLLVLVKLKSMNHLLNPVHHLELALHQEIK